MILCLAYLYLTLDCSCWGNTFLYLSNLCDLCAIISKGEKYTLHSCVRKLTTPNFISLFSLLRSSKRCIVIIKGKNMDICACRYEVNTIVAKPVIPMLVTYLGASMTTMLMLVEIVVIYFNSLMMAINLNIFQVSSNRRFKVSVKCFIWSGVFDKRTRRFRFVKEMKC